MTSRSLANKIEAQRRMAPAQIEKARLCSQVVLALLRGAEDLDRAIADLKAGLGQNWSIVTAFQFMTGRQAQLAGECAELTDKQSILLAHQLAESVSREVRVSRMAITHLRALAVSAMAELRSTVKKNDAQGA